MSGLHSLNYWKSRRAVENRHQELSALYGSRYETTFKTPDISIRAHISHFLDPEHLTSVHSGTLFGLKLGKIIEISDRQLAPFMIFEVGDGKNISLATLKILGPFDVEMQVEEKDSRMHILFSANPRPADKFGAEDSELHVSMFTNNFVAGLLLAPVAGVTYLEDRSYLKATQQEIERIFAAPVRGGYRALFDAYRRDYEPSLDRLIHQAMMPAGHPAVAALTVAPVRSPVR